MKKRTPKKEVKKFNRSDWGRRTVSIEKILAHLKTDSFKRLMEDANEGMAMDQSSDS